VRRPDGGRPEEYARRFGSPGGGLQRRQFVISGSQFEGRTGGAAGFGEGQGRTFGVRRLAHCPGASWLFIEAHQDFQNCTYSVSSAEPSKRRLSEYLSVCAVL